MAAVELHDEIVDWLDTLSDREWDRVVVIADRLAGPAWVHAPGCRCRNLGDGLFELRSTFGATARRITYRFTRDGRIILLTTFRKQRNNETDEITRARKVADDCARRYP